MRFLMRFRTWYVAALGLGGLLLLIAVSMLAASRKAQAIYAQLDQLNTHHHEVDTKLRRLRSDVNLSGIFVRDYLLDISRERAPEYRERLAEFRKTNMATVAELRAVAELDQDQIRRLETSLDAYWQTFDPLFDWTATEKIFRSASFLRREVVPRREAALAIAEQIEQLNNANLADQRAEVARNEAIFRNDFRRLWWQSLLLGFFVALTVVLRLRVLEQRSDEQRAIAEDAERQMRRLSQQLVATQEEERKHLSRELHDHVAQVLTGLRMELGRIERTKGPVDVQVVAAVAEAKKLVDDMFRTVRDLALGLRPSMLDDFGLQPALEWHVRDFTARYSVNAELHTAGDFSTLPEAHRTCVYRAVQEALTNSARHAKASSIRVNVTGHADSLDVSVSDDGVGIEPARRHSGLGLRGIEERVKELHGTMTIDRGTSGGTILTIHLPLPPAVMEVPRARVAG
jgi:signal transduction histidine kinase